MYCPKCGREHKTDDRYCVKCGHPLSQPQSTSSIQEKSYMPSPRQVGENASVQRAPSKRRGRLIRGILVAVLVIIGAYFLKGNEKSELSHLERGNNHLSAGEWQEAVTEYTKAIELGGEDVGSA